MPVLFPDSVVDRRDDAVGVDREEVEHQRADDAEHGRRAPMPRANVRIVTTVQPF
jgi:hypothetical protein